MSTVPQAHQRRSPYNDSMTTKPTAVSPSLLHYWHSILNDLILGNFTITKPCIENKHLNSWVLATSFWNDSIMACRHFCAKSGVREGLKRAKRVIHILAMGVSQKILDFILFHNFQVTNSPEASWHCAWNGDLGLNSFAGLFLLCESKDSRCNLDQGLLIYPM